MKTCIQNIRCASPRIAGFLSLAFLCFAIAPVSASAERFDGAVWRFTMTPRDRSLAPLKGSYRISDHVMFQRETPYDPDFTRYVGNNYPRGNRTRFEVSGLRVFNDRGQHVGKINGAGAISLVSYGDWTGTFVDGAGRTYDFRCCRVAE